MGMQDSRRGDEWPLVQDNDEDYDWTELTKGGRNGFYLLILALAWWKTVVKTAADHSAFDSAVMEMTWALESILHNLKSSESSKKRKSGNETVGSRRVSKR